MMMMMMMIVVWLVLILYQRDLGLDSTDIFSQASAAHPTIDPLAFVFTLIMIGMKVGMVMRIMLFLMMVMMMMVVMIVVMMMMMVMIVVMMMLVVMIVVVMMLVVIVVVVKCRIGVARRFSKAGKQIGTEAAFPVHGW